LLKVSAGTSNELARGPFLFVAIVSRHYTWTQLNVLCCM